MLRIFGALFLFLLTAGTHAGSLVGYVVHADGAPIAGARVSVTDINRSTITDINGRFDLGTVEDGAYELVVTSTRHPASTATVDVSADGSTPEFLRLGRDLLPKVVVVGTPLGTEALEMTQPASMLEGLELSRKLESTLGDTLMKEVGVSSTYSGPGASRPVIRGLAGNRVRVQSDGITSMDASTSSNDHAVGIEPLLADRIEVIRGPGVLAYGSNAIGGVVNVVDNRIPEVLPAAAFSGAAELRLNSVADGVDGVARLDGGSGGLAWHVDAYGRDHDDYDIPGFAEAEPDLDHEEEEAFGALPNSFVESRGGTLGGSYIADWGFVGASINVFATEYGVPGTGHGHGDDDHDDGDHDDEEEASVSIDLDQIRADFKGQVDEPVAALERIRFRLGVSDYEHVELEGNETGTLFENDEYEGRAEAVHNPALGWRGAFGLQFGDRDFSALGEEAFVPPSNTNHWGLFLIEEYNEIENWRFELGARLDRSEVSIDNGQNAMLPDGVPSDRDYRLISGSAGVRWQVNEQWSLTGNLARAGRSPTVEELYSNGPHLASQSFDVGDPLLDEERVTSVDLSLGFSEGPWFANLGWFLNDFEDFIYQEESGEIEDGLPVRPWTQANADFDGWELEGGFSAIQSPVGLWSARAFFDTVSGELDRGGNLPRITPDRVGLEIDWEKGHWHAGMDVIKVDDQTDVATNEMPTDGYTLFNADVSYQFSSGGVSWDVFLRGRNLSDEEARVHTSFLKDQAPLPGRNLILGVRASF